MQKLTGYFFALAACCLFFAGQAFAQDSDIEFTLDISSRTVPLPAVFKPNIDLSGRGYHRAITWPQNLAAKKVLDAWESDIGFSGMYRIQYNLWEINQLAKFKDLQDQLLGNYESVIKSISNSGGIVILDIFGTPAGLGKVLDKKSPPWDLKAFKELIKNYIRDLSCNKKYNIWYEIWSAPDLGDFFLGKKQEYLSLYKVVAEAVKELEEETKMHIPIGAPSVSWWFQNLDGNTIITPERSLIYELIKFCYSYHLPLDFITWHGYSTSSGVEQEATIYKKTAVNLIRDWLSYFNFNKNTPLVVDEWNYDSGANVLPERQEDAYISASYIPSRLKNMYEAGIDYQLYFCLEDFFNKKEGVARNVGVFWFDLEASEYKGNPKSTYNVFKMLSRLGPDMFLAPAKVNDEFVGTIATKTQDGISLVIYNYIDPEAGKSYLSNNIATLNEVERKSLLNLITTNRIAKIFSRELEVSSLRLPKKEEALLLKARELNDRAAKFRASPRNLKLTIKNMQEDYLYHKFIVDSSCNIECEFIPAEKKEVRAADVYQETLSLKPYSVNMIIFKKKAKEPEVPPGEAKEPAIPKIISEGSGAGKSLNITEEAPKSEAAPDAAGLLNNGEF